MHTEHQPETSLNYPLSLGGLTTTGIQHKTHGISKWNLESLIKWNFDKFPIGPYISRKLCCKLSCVLWCNRFSLKISMHISRHICTSNITTLTCVSLLVSNPISLETS